jgi:transcriptional regulator with XRE-family HTH domain
MKHLSKNPYAERLFQAVLMRCEIKNIYALAKQLKVTPGAISRIRSGENGLSLGMIMRIHILTKWPVEEIQKLAGVKNVP